MHPDVMAFVEDLQANPPTDLATWLARGPEAKRAHLKGFDIDDLSDKGHARRVAVAEKVLPDQRWDLESARHTLHQPGSASAVDTGRGCGERPRIWILARAQRLPEVRPATGMLRLLRGHPPARGSAWRGLSTLLHGAVIRWGLLLLNRSRHPWPTEVIDRDVSPDGGEEPADSEGRRRTSGS